MTEKFTASNGVRIWQTRDPLGVAFAQPTLGIHDHIRPETADALREYFQHERDEQLGRFRYTRDGQDYLVYPSALWENPPSPDEVRVVNEANGVSTRERREHDTTCGDWFSDVARDYFEAHPTRKPWGPNERNEK